MHALLAAPDCVTFLAEELGRSSSLIPAQGEWLEVDDLGELPLLPFARQVLPQACRIEAASINSWADAIAQAVSQGLPHEQPWRLHLWPQYGEGRAGRHRCQLIREAVHERLKKRARGLLRRLEDTDHPFRPETSLVQAALTDPGAGYLSLAPAPQPHAWRAVVSSFTAGDVPVAEDKAAPSRAFAKLAESEQRLGRRISPGQTCVDLGASPGSWTYVALQRGARVTAIDRSPLRDDLMRHPRLHFLQADAFRFKPDTPVDWLICDIIAAPQRSIDLLLEWLAERRMRQFVVTIKFKGTDEYGVLSQLKDRAPGLCADFRLNRLCSNKNEVCAFGVVS
jgi:23S rRNA (cytidine2498-2'-O)-methyltransferase